MTNELTDPRHMLVGFMDTQQAAALLGRSRATVYDMAEKGLLTRYRVGAAVLWWGPEVGEVAYALKRLRVRVRA